MFAREEKQKEEEEGEKKEETKCPQEGLTIAIGGVEWLEPIRKQLEMTRYLDHLADIHKWNGVLPSSKGEMTTDGSTKRRKNKKV